MGYQAIQRGYVKGFVIVAVVLVVSTFGALYGVKQINIHRDKAAVAEQTSGSAQQPAAATDKPVNPKSDRQQDTKKEEVRRAIPDTGAGSAHQLPVGASPESGHVSGDPQDGKAKHESTLPTTGPSNVLLSAFAAASVVVAILVYRRSSRLV